MEILKNPHFDFLGKTRILMTTSVVVILCGLAYISKNGVRYGVEFQGGSQLIVKFQSPPAQDRVRRAVDEVTTGASIQAYDIPSKHQVLVRLPAGGEGDLSGPAQAVLRALKTSYSENPVVESSSEIVGPIVGSELRQKAIYLTLFGLTGQLIYIAWRFRGIIWGTAATIAVFHDVLITLGLIAILRFEITLNVIAALLTLVGYSVNDTIVIFDRVRENLRQRRKEPLSKIINDSVNQTLSRTLISSGTTFLTVLGLFLFGGEVLRGFGFTMVVGIVVGTYSTIYIASPIVVWWQERFQGPSAGAKAAL
jgi:preprotein translocase subunit SecF